MKYNVKEYVKIITDVFEPNICQSIIEQIEGNKQEKHFWSNHHGDRYTDKSELDVSYQKTTYDDLIYQRLREIVLYYQKEVIDNNEWKDYQEISKLRYNIYRVGHSMKFHVDHIHSLYQGSITGVPILSIVGMLNDDYQGGDFIMWNNFRIPLSRGSVLVFPSTFMYPHEIKPVITGTRYSYVSWVS